MSPFPAVEQTMAYLISDSARMASAAAVLLLALCLLLRHILLPRLGASQLRRFDAPLVLLLGVFLVYLVGNFLESLP
jgi:hypothetical protein